MGKVQNMGRVEDTMNIDYNSSRRSHEYIKVSFMKYSKKTANDFHLKAMQSFSISVHIENH